MADLAKIEPVLMDFLTDGMGYSKSEIETFFTDELADGYYWDAIEWNMVGRPSLHEWNPSSGVVNPVSPAQAVEVTPETKFWLSETGESVGAAMDTLRIPDIAAALPSPKTLLYTGLAIVAALAVIAVAR